MKNHEAVGRQGLNMAAACRKVREGREQGGTVISPDGRRVVLDRDDPLSTLGHLIKEDTVQMPRTRVGGRSLRM